MPGTTNLLLDSLTRDGLHALHARDEHHPIATVLITADEIPGLIFFPQRGAVVSIVQTTEDGSMVEAGVIGNEGLFSVHTAITVPAPTGSAAIVQIEGRFWRVEAERLRDQFRNDKDFRDRVLAFTSAYLGQVTQSLVCNRLHPIEQRLAKWLLVVRDRVDNDVLHLTQDFLAHMLGTHRPGVSLAIAALEIDALITHGRSVITLRDRESLMARACECYAVNRATLSTFEATFAA